MRTSPLPAPSTSARPSPLRSLTRLGGLCAALLLLAAACGPAEPGTDGGGGMMSGGDDGGGVSGDDAGDDCVPETCESLGFECDSYDDGCGGSTGLCGSCPAGPCEDGTCTETGVCSYDAPGACNNEPAVFCFEGQCVACSEGYRNCNGQYGCECLGECDGTECLGECMSGIECD